MQREVKVKNSSEKVLTRVISKLLVIFKTNKINDRIEQKTMISHITLPVFCNDTEYMPVKNSSFLYKEVISCTPFS